VLGLEALERLRFFFTRWLLMPASKSTLALSSVLATFSSWLGLSLKKREAITNVSICSFQEAWVCGLPLFLRLFIVVNCD
jgi:hypothetical protein